MLLELIPLALVIALSPLSVIPAVLVLQTPRPRAAGPAFLVGWLAGLAVLTLIALRLSGLAGGMHDHPPGWASWLRVVVGTALIVWGGYRWFTRHRSHQAPKWMTGLQRLTPARAGATGLLLTVVNPKVLFVCLAAGLAIGTAGVSLPQVWAGAAWFVAVAASTVAAPTLAYAAAGDRLDPLLDRLRAWMDRRHAALVAGILVVIGIMVLYKGVHHLATVG
ncbi:hypothetical protein MHAS_04683 [Mycolicibacterium hassiacum DSM 44199]|uniref:GAP family protein n=1 Tax=Mycolicibacterium hassiacum TaxID=46351 RepID=UPI0003825847|nr:GAP family protein [Mycolicibacterium hassiacum]MDA4086128.1 hypothetical protein [Mycolicibacterium hassiacum DSM 44199]VCT92946.1 hypothetical protein MHAS_04683 [Mycolicibacterium hassiacum DSM 44199]